MRGQGIFAEQIRTLFVATARRAGLTTERVPLDTSHFRRSGGEQLTLL